MARDEWPLLGLAIEHVLGGHVQHVVVLDHASRDQTRAGLNALQQCRPGQLTVVRLDDPAYLQEAATALMTHMGPAPGFDWIYVFDADEFILPAEGLSLGDVLEHVDASVDVVRYEVHNWVAPRDFDDQDLTAYPALRYRAVPNVFLETGPETPDDIENGDVNFFDVPFPPKVIVRAAASGWIAAGAHSVRYPPPNSVESLPATTLRAAHLPLLSMRRLELKCRQGQALIDAGFPPGHGWQNQMLRRIEISQRLTGFWGCHSLPTPGVASHLTGPNLVPDDGLREALESAVLRAGEWQAGGFGNLERRTVAVDVAFRVIGSMQLAASRYAARLGDAEHAKAVLAEEGESLRARQTALVAERDALVAERDALVAERDALVAERDALATTLAAVYESRAWRATQPLRALRRRFRG